MFKLPDTTLFGKSVEMKFKVSGKIQWFKGQIKLCMMDWLGNTEFTSHVMVRQFMCIPTTKTWGLLANCIADISVHTDSFDNFLLALHQTLVHTSIVSVWGSIISTIIFFFFGLGLEFTHLDFQLCTLNYVPISFYYLTAVTCYPGNSYSDDRSILFSD